MVFLKWTVGIILKLFIMVRLIIIEFIVITIYTIPRQQIHVNKMNYESSVLKY